MKLIEHVKPVRLAAPRGRAEVFTKLARVPGIQMIYVSALACTRHRTVDFVELQRMGRLSFLTFSEVDMITGDYIQKARDAAAEIAAERSPSGIVLLTGCQSALLSTDYKLLSEEIEQEIGVPVRVHDGCRLCGFDEENGGSSAIDKLLYSFLLPAPRSGEPTVNLLGTARVDESGELFSVLSAAGVKKINRLSACRTFEDYQEMSRAHVNILTTPQDIPIGQWLEETLGIPFVCLGGVYDGGELAAAYRKLGELLGAQPDVAAAGEELARTLSAVRTAADGRGIAVEDDAELAKWLVCEGFSVESLQMGHHQGLSPEQKSWFSEHAPALRVAGEQRGKPGGPGGPGGGRGPGGPGGGRPGGGHPGKPGGRPEGKRPGAPEAAKLGYQGALAVLDALKTAMEGQSHE